MSYHANKLVDTRTDGPTHRDAHNDNIRPILVLGKNGPWFAAVVMVVNINWFTRRLLIPWCHPVKTRLSVSWWRHQMETFSTLLTICAGNSPVPSEFPTQRPVMRSFDVFFDLRPNKRFSKQRWGWWFEMPSCSLWRHCNDPCWFNTPQTILSCNITISKTMLLLVERNTFACPHW